MAVRGIVNSVGISLDISSPLWYSEQIPVASITNKINSYQHTTSAEAGFASAQMSFAADAVDIDDWLENGLGRHLAAHGAHGEVIWEGFVSRVTIGIGSLSASRGPLFDIANRVSVVYTPVIDVDVDPPVTGSETETPIAEDTNSQARYGIIEKVISGGQLVDDGVTDEAEEVRNLYLEEYKNPYTDESLNVASSNPPTITLDCLGYKEWLKVYVYNYYTTPTTITLTTKIQNIIGADPNSLIKTSYQYVESNAQLTNELEDKNRFANTIIDEIVALGDASDNRWIFNIYEDRIPRYHAIPTEVEYLHSLTAERQQVTTLYGTVVDPWDVRAGKWVEVTDFLSGIERPSLNLRDNPRNLFAETVTYTMPFGLTISGSRVSSLKQRFSQLGVGGV